MVLRIFLFLVINFAALGIGGYFTNPQSDWYVGLNKAPWTPPGWVFGAAWTLIMVCFSIYLALLWSKVENRNVLISLIALQWLLNVGWNVAFFNAHEVLIGLVMISILTLTIAFLIINYWSGVGWWSLLILPYFIWLCIATSLNAYVLIYN